MFPFPKRRTRAELIWARSLPLLAEGKQVHGRQALREIGCPRNRLGEVISDQRPRAGRVDLLKLLQPRQRARVVDRREEVREGSKNLYLSAFRQESGTDRRTT